MAKPKKGPAFTIVPKRILAFDALLSDGGMDSGDDQLDFLAENTVDLSFLEKGEVNIVDLVEQAVEERSLVPRDLKFDDSSMPIAKNFLDWLTNPNFLKATPYLEQALIGIRLFSEFCPRCSNTKWIDIENHEPQEGIAGIKKNLVLLEHNKCPKCGVRRSELLRTKELNFYNELAVNAGQRCVAPSTPVITGQGIMPIGHMMIGHDVPGFHKARLNLTAHNGKSIAPVKQVYISDKAKTHCIVLANGIFIEATAEHPIRTETGFRHASKIDVGEKCPVYVGTNVWGKLKQPTTLYEAGLSTRDAALKYIIDASTGGYGQPSQVYSGTGDDAQMVWTILLNAGYLPEVHRFEDTFYVVFDLEDIQPAGTVLLDVIDVMQTGSQITYDLVMDGMPQFLAAGLMNHNSGKSIVTAMISTYLTHKVLMCQSPTGILDIDSTTVLHGTFVALTQKQASDTLWTPYYNYILGSPWFQRYHALIRTMERKFGIEVMKIRDTFVLYGHRNLVVYPAGPDGRILRGRTRLFAAIDEVAYFDNDADSKKVKASASMVYGALDRSLATVRSSQDRQIAAGYDAAFTGYFFNISSPVHARDKINELLRLSYNSRSILGIHAPTWKMNPTMPRNSEFLVEAFRRDPIGAARDYGAEAPMSASPFITQPTFIEAAIRAKGRNLCVYTHNVIKHRDGKKQRYGTLVKCATTGQPSIMAIDAGYTNNSFALTVGTRTEAGIINVDCLVEIIPQPGIPLNYTLIFDELIVPLAKARNVQVLLADQWQSIKLLQDGKLKAGIEDCDKYSLKYVDLWAVKSMLETEVPMISLPRMVHAKTIQETLEYDGDDYPRCFEGKPAEHLIMQMQTVQDTGHSVIKNTGATDDIWRALALMVYGFNCGDYDETLTVKVDTAINRDPSRLGTMGHRRNSGSAQITKSAPAQAIGASRTRLLVRK
ncbi:terminase large subunit [Yersinia phage fHe-Yen9-02]|nr:terminase large subunit [Yersinia phage fHe-Yen9-02]